MLDCKNKFFKRLLFFSLVFLVFSFFYNQLTYASGSEKTSILKQNVGHLKAQQKRIISSLKNIEDCLSKQKETKNE
tara:strand:- start:423 stop:650 length:228 start_codon:yes stop_codon:yes gene_type:complete